MLWSVIFKHNETGRCIYHCNDVIMNAMAFEITSLAMVYWTVYSGADQRKHQGSALLAFVGEFTGDRWIPRTKGQKCEKCFHLMTSSYASTHWVNIASDNGLSPVQQQAIIWTNAGLSSTGPREQSAEQTNMLSAILDASTLMSLYCQMGT